MSHDSCPFFQKITLIFQLILKSKFTYLAYFQKKNFAYSTYYHSF